MYIFSMAVIQVVPLEGVVCNSDLFSYIYGPDDSFHKCSTQNLYYFDCVVINKNSATAC